MPLEASSLTAALLVNDLESVAAARYPQIAEIKAKLQNLGAVATAMSGSGGAVFALFPNESAALTATETAAVQMPGARFFMARVIAGD
jgi:4-diphosphocytidyl-2-C-methyl-D-erythritol kinase